MFSSSLPNLPTRRFQPMDCVSDSGVGGGPGGAVGCGGGGGSYLSTTPPSAVSSSNNDTADSSTSATLGATPAALSLPVGLSSSRSFHGEVPGSPLSEGGDNRQQFSMSDAKREEQVTTREKKNIARKGNGLFRSVFASSTPRAYYLPCHSFSLLRTGMGRLPTRRRRGG